MEDISTPLAKEIAQILLHDVQAGLMSGKHLRNYREVLRRMPESMPSDDKAKAALASLLVDQATFTGQYVAARERQAIERQKQKGDEADRHHSAKLT